MMRVLLLFLDGVGIGPMLPDRNPFAAAPPRTLGELTSTERATLAPLDARLETSGLPQSGTGQFSLFTGQNGAALFGRHHGPYVPTALRTPLMNENVLTRARQAGRAVAFANSYPEELIASATASGSFVAIGPLRAGPPLVAAGAGVLTRHTRELERGDAVSSEITNTAWREKLHRTSLPEISPAQAGANLARLANAHELTLFAHYATDAAGHEQDLDAAIEALARVDEFLEGTVAELQDDVVMIIASDHGNLEDATTGHTTNPAFGMVYGPSHAHIARGMTDIRDVSKTIARLLDLQ